MTLSTVANNASFTNDIPYHIYKIFPTYQMYHLSTRQTHIGNLVDKSEFFYWRHHLITPDIYGFSNPIPYEDYKAEYDILYSLHAHINDLDMFKNAVDTLIHTDSVLFCDVIDHITNAELILPLIDMAIKCGFNLNNSYQVNKQSNIIILRYLLEHGYDKNRFDNCFFYDVGDRYIIDDIVNNTLR